MLYTIYQITNLLNGKTYIGRHQTNNLDDGYMGSGKHIRKAITKYGHQNFLKEILFIFDNEEDMNNKEIELVNESYCDDRSTYNIALGGKGGCYAQETLWITNGSEDRRLRQSEEIPDGWRYGRSVIFEFMWINDGKVQKRVHPDFPIPEGWKRGILDSTRLKTHRNYPIQNRKRFK